MISRAIILATRDPYHNSQLTYNRNHAMLPALGKPLIARIMDRIYMAGIRNFTVVLGEDEGEVAFYLNKWMPDVKLEFVLEKYSTNLARTLRPVLEKHEPPYFFCLYNSFAHPKLPARLLTSFQDSPADLIISGATTTLSQSPAHHFGIINGTGLTSIVSERPQEKSMVLNDIGIFGKGFADYILTIQPSRTGSLQTTFLEITRNYLANGGEARVVDSGWSLRINSDQDLLTLNNHLLHDVQDAHLLSEMPASVQIISPVRIDPQVNIGQGARIGPDVYLERGCSIGQGAQLKNCIVLSNVNVPAQSNIENTIVSTRGRVALPSHS